NTQLSTRFQKLKIYGRALASYNDTASRIAPVAQHLREIRGKPFSRAKARTPQSVEILFEVTRVIGFVKGNREVFKHRIVIGLVAGLQRIDEDQHATRPEHATDLLDNSATHPR